MLIIPFTCGRLLIPGRKAKLSQLQAERRELKTVVENQETKINKLQQFLNEANERRDADAKNHVETYGRNLYLESSLAAVQRGEPFEEYITTDTNRVAAPGDTKESPVTASTRPQSDNKRLEQPSMTAKQGRDNVYADIVATLEQIKYAVAGESHEDLLATLERLKEATASGETTESSDETRSRNLDGKLRKILDGRERVARKQEVLDSVLSSQHSVLAPPLTSRNSKSRTKAPS